MKHPKLPVPDYAKSLFGGTIKEVPKTLWKLWKRGAENAARGQFTTVALGNANQFLGSLEVIR